VTNIPNSFDDVDVKLPVRSAKKHAAKIIEPTLANYFAEAKISAPAFLKALRLAKITRFDHSDQAKAAELMGANDPAGERLWALLVQARLPEPVEHWIWPAIQLRMRVAIGGSFDPTLGDAAEVFNGAIEALSANLKSQEKTERKRAEMWLRICLTWLLSRRGLEPWFALSRLRTVFFRRRADAVSSSDVALKRGRLIELKQAVGVAYLADTLVDEARRMSEAERQTATQWRDKFNHAVEEADRLKSELTQQREKAAQYERELAEAKSRLEAEKHHRGHAISQVHVGLKVLLNNRLGPLVSDAIDALEIDEPALSVALRRLKSINSILDEEASKT
jgi:hypothetical protein